MKVKLVQVGLLIAIVFGLIACAEFPKNPRLKEINRSEGYRFENLEIGSKNTDDLFVILTFSGAATPAATLAYGVLEALRDTKITWGNKEVSLLDEVDIIFANSGGSFTAAYYGLYGQGIFKEFEKKFLYRAIDARFLFSIFTPEALFKLPSSEFSRSDLFSEYLSDNLFNGATYADLIAKKKRPFIVLNSTDTYNGSSFLFTQDQFDLICSDLSGVPIARAVVASAVYPLVLPPLAFVNYAGNCGYVEPRWVDLALRDRQNNLRRAVLAENLRSYTEGGLTRRSFLHLTDGSVTDNSGLHGVLEAITTTKDSWSLLRKINRQVIKKIVVITVNAPTATGYSRNGNSPETPDLGDTIKITSSISINNFSTNTMDLISAKLTEINSLSQYEKVCTESYSRQNPDQDIQNMRRRFYEVDFYPILVDLEKINDTNSRMQLKNIYFDESYSINEKNVNALRRTGRELLVQDQNFKRLLRDLKEQ